MSDIDSDDIRRLDGGLLLVFRELFQRRRTTAVAAHLGLSQSAISHALARLRDVFGEVLFVRRSHGLEPTQRAIELAPRIERLIALMGEAMTSKGEFDPAKSHRRFRVACPDYVASLIGAPLVETFRRQAPFATFSARTAFLDRALRAVRRGEADVALGVFAHLPSGFSATALFDDEYCVIARRGHPRVKGAVDLATYADIGHVFVGDPDGAFADDPPIARETIDATYGPIAAPNRVRTHAYLSSWETAMLVVAGGDVLADCPRLLARRYANTLGLQALDPPFPAFRFTVQAVRRAETADAGLDWFLSKLAEAVR
jgi:LysR family transcriptional activator of mexEF-oprN operon